ncbi:unnamed protein product [Rotaria sp. Silwood1]|nr:unnamed protein product [Rotaria sp. Silwood1]
MWGPPMGPIALNVLIEFCKRLYKNDKDELRILESFEKTYSPDDAITCKKEFERLQNSKGEFLSINSFLLTNVNRKVAFGFADYRQLYEHVEKEIVDENPTYCNLAELFYRLGDYDRSERYFNLHLKYRGRPEDIVLCHAGLSKVVNRKTYSGLEQKHLTETMQSLQNPTKAITEPKLIQKLEAAQSQLFDKNKNCDVYILRTHANMENKRDDLALIYYETALAIQKRQLPSDHPDIERTLFQMGQCYVALKKFEEGLQFMKQALEIREKSLPSNYRDLALTYSSLGSVYLILMKNDLALKHSIKTRERHHASGRPDQLDLWIIKTSIRRIQI